MTRRHSREKHGSSDSEPRAFSGNSARRALIVPFDQRGCRNCANGRNIDRGDRCFPQYVFRLDELAGQRGLPSLHARPERDATYRCENWETSQDE